MVWVLGSLLIAFTLGAIWFIHDAVVRNDHCKMGRCSTCIQDGVCICGDEITYK